LTKIISLLQWTSSIQRTKEGVMTDQRRLPLVPVLLFALSVFSLSAQGSAAGLPSKLVSPEWLKASLGSKDVRIVDVRANVADYWAGHIPGAVYFHPDAMRLADRGVPVMLMPPEALAVMLGKMGISKKTSVVVYTEKGDFKATYLVWALDYLGHASSGVLEGGFGKWQAGGNPVTQDYPKISAVQYGGATKLQNGVRANLAEVKKIVETGGALILDVRPVDLYTGEKGAWKRKGHIKGSISRFWGEDLKEDGTWKDRDELRAAYEKLGGAPEKPVIASCGQGQMSSHTYFTLRYLLGYKSVKNYDGSFNEWSSIPELPIETGMK
jgi:thiosulfate/3-mercaptopyruvate sulfurtransferase